jgi:hypothetical protein
VNFPISSTFNNVKMKPYFISIFVMFIYGCFAHAHTFLFVAIFCEASRVVFDSVT